MRTPQGSARAPPGSPLRHPRSSVRSRSPLRRERAPSSSPLRSERAPSSRSPQVPVRSPVASPQPVQRPPPTRSPRVVESPLLNPPQDIQMPAQQASVQGAVGEEQHQRDERLRRLSREEMAMARPLEPPVEEIPFGDMVANESLAHQAILEQLRPFFPQIRRVRNSATQKYSFEFVGSFLLR